MNTTSSTFSSAKYVFSFCDFADRPWVSDDSGQRIDIDFVQRGEIRVWSCGFCRGDEIIEGYVLSGGTGVRGFARSDSSFVLYDQKAEKIIAARDALGSFPLFYHSATTVAGKPRWVFSFSMKALVESGLIEPAINSAKVGEYLSADHHRPPDDHTFYQGVYRLLPGYAFCLQGDEPAKGERYHRFDLSKYNGFGDRRWIDSLRTLFVASVKKNTAGYTRIAATLSGGLDSSSVCGVSQSLRTDALQTMNFKTETGEAGEDAYIEAVVEKWHLHHRTVSSSHRDDEAIRKIVEQNGQPFFVFNHTIQLDLIAEAKAAGCDIFLSGHWGDQVIGYGVEYLDELLSARNWPALKIAIGQQVKNSFKMDGPESGPEGEGPEVKRYAAGLFLQKWKNKNRRVRWLSIGWILFRHFDFSLKDFAGLVRRRWRKEKAVVKPKTGSLLTAEFRAEADRVRKDFPPRALQVDETVRGALNAAQRKHLEGFYRASRIYGQEEYFEIYRWHGLRVAQPFYDPALLELNLAIPARLKFGEGRKRETLRLAMKDYLPEAVANRVTKAEFSRFYADRLAIACRDFLKLTPGEHAIWGMIDRDGFMELAAILSDPETPAKTRGEQIPFATKTIILAAWLDYVARLKKNDGPKPAATLA